MKRIILAILISLMLVGIGHTWEAKTLYQQYAASGTGQTMLYVDSTEYCHVIIAYVCNDGSTTSTVSMHFEGTGSAANRLIPPISLAAGEGVIIDLSKSNYFVIGDKGRGIEVDSSATTTINAFVVYFTAYEKKDR